MRRPSLALGRYDGMARFLSSAWMLWVLAQGGAPLLWLLLVPEFAWGVVQWWPLEQSGRHVAAPDDFAVAQHFAHPVEGDHARLAVVADDFK